MLKPIKRRQTLGYFESDREFLENNREFCVNMLAWALHNKVYFMGNGKLNIPAISNIHE